MTSTGRDTLVERVADVIRRRIVGGALAPGEPLRQSALAQTLGVSPTPLREALRGLQAEGYVTLHSYRGMVVARPTVGEIEDLTEMRIALDTLAVRRSIPRLVADDFDELERILDDRDRATDALRAAELLTAFFFALFRPLQGTCLLDHAALLIRRGTLYSAMLWRIPADRRAPPDDLRELVAACRQGDADAAGRLIATCYRAAAAAFIRHYGPLLTLGQAGDAEPVTAGPPAAAPRERRLQDPRADWL